MLLQGFFCGGEWFEIFLLTHQGWILYVIESLTMDFLLLKNLCKSLVVVSWVDGEECQVH